MKTRLLIAFTFLFSLSTALAHTGKCSFRISGANRDFSLWREQADLAVSTSISDQVPPSHLPVLLIGAGPAGVANAVELQVQGIDFEAVERNSRVGGVWDIQSPWSPAYENLKTNSSKATTHLSSPVPKGLPDYLSHAQARDYLEGLATDAGVLSRFRFGHQVERVEKVENGALLVKIRNLASGETYQKEYRLVIAATGSYSTESAWTPENLQQQATASGLSTLHTSTYKSPEPYRNKNVLILGIGNSGSEIATDISKVAAKTYLSVRTTPWFVPEYVGWIPADEFAATSPPFLPHWAEMALFRGIVRLTTGYPQKFGFPKPPHDLLDQIPVADRGILAAIKSGTIELKPNVLGFDSGKAIFQDPQQPAAIDSVVFATGYRAVYPFLPEELWPKGESGEELLSFGFFHREHSGLIILQEPHVAQGIWPIFPVQARAVAQYLKARDAQTENYAHFLRLRRYPNPDFKGYIFRTADKRHVDFKIYETYIQQVGDWFAERRPPQTLGK